LKTVHFYLKDSAENLSEVMLDNFVDIEGSSVLLVFEDGEQRCHTFPLAAREDSSAAGFV
jgi:hypothetical protein